MKGIEDCTNGKLKEIIDFADNNKLTTELWLTLSRFFRYVTLGNKVVLASDFAPLSLTFGIYNENGQQTLNGGFIFHGSTTGSAPNFSVSLDNSNKPRWQIHT